MLQNLLTGNFGFVNLKLVLVASILSVAFVLLLTFYGTTILPYIPDESLFLQPAQNLSNGQGMGTQMLDELLPGISQRTYWQPPVYFLALSVWCKVFGFNVLSSRWLSRICAVIALVLLCFLAKRWGLPDSFVFLCLLWTALDLSFQYSANLGRMEILNCVWMLSCLITFTTYWGSRGKQSLLLAGLFAALATLTHFVAIPAVITLALALGLRRQKDLVRFSLPLLVGWALWAVYALQDLESFLGQIGAQLARKGEGGFAPFPIKSMFLTGSIPFFGVFPANSPPLWFALSTLSLWAWLRKKTPLEIWQTFCLLAIYAGGALGGEVWYAGWFAPFGYLLLTVWLYEFSRWFPKTRWQIFCVALTGYQLLQITRVLISVPSLSQDISRFLADVQKPIPHGAKILTHSVPDPFPVLSEGRSDLHLVQVSPTPMPEEKLRKALQQSSHLVAIPKWGEERLGIKLPLPEKTWRFKLIIGSWVVGLYRLKPMGWDDEAGRKR
ncbi:MAG: glycosyltransferase family 39 protein [Candidatus Fervidibacter sp.]|uniref:glycosyltransferase family 39 protein n=1 Tax=Candidatus Fervidibacter sp. TaxID=3100871 RepID=UPI0040492FD3